MRRAAALLLAVAALQGCKRSDMYTQDSKRSWDRSSFFTDGATMRPAVAGTVPRDAPDPDVPEPAAITQAMLERGRQRFDIFCTGCHGMSGDGEGMIVQRGFPHPPQLYSPPLLKAKASFLYDVITKGHGVMYGFADRVPSADRWDVVAYIRALQQSQAADPSKLPDEDREKLEPSQ